MGHEHDYIERLRHWILPKIGVITQWLEDFTGGKYYAISETHNNQFVGRVPMNEEQFEKELHDMDFTRNPLSSWKTLNSSGEGMEGSWRKVGFEDHPNMQLHVVLYDGDKQQDAGDTGYTYVYAHWEHRWDTNPLKHLRTVDFNAQEGVQRMKKLLNENGINHEPIRP